MSDLTPVIFVFIGPPGSGKGTVAQCCVDRFGWVSLSTGALCRQHISEQTVIGKKIDFIIKSGKLIPDELVTAMVEFWLDEQLPRAASVILDGYPRTRKQAAMFLDLLRNKYKHAVLRVVKFDISDDQVMRRLSSRLVCQNIDCQRVYSTLPEARLLPNKVGTCDVCDSPLIQRIDDRPEVVRERLSVFHDHDPSELFMELKIEVERIDANDSFEVIVDVFKRFVKCGLV